MPSNESNTKPHLFVSGVFRSGTTFLSRALDSHPKLTVLSDPFREFFKYLRNKFYRRHLENFDEGQPISDYFLEDPELRNDFQKFLFQLELNNEDIDLIKSKVVKGAKQFSPKIADYIEELKPAKALEVYKQLLKLSDSAYFKDSSQLIGNKEVWTDEFIEPHLQIGSKCIQVIRDPRAVISSNRKSSTGAYPILFLIRQWRKSVAYYLKNANKENYLFLPYEELVTDSENAFRKTLNFIGVDFHNNVMDPSQFKDGFGNPWQQNSSHGTSQKINKEFMDKWKEVLGEEELHLIEWFCKPEMDLLGYEHQLAKSEFPSKDDLYEESYHNLAGWISKYNYFLDDKAIEDEKKRYTMLFQDVSNQNEIERYFLNQEAYDGLKF